MTMSGSMSSQALKSSLATAKERTMIEDVSFVVIARNEEFAVEKCLHALLAMPLHNCEILAVDSDSSDGTLDVMRRHASESAVVSVFRIRGRLNAAVARNVGLDRARKKYICFCDGDTEWESPFLLEALRIMEAGEAEAVTGCLRERVYAPSWERVIETRMRKSYPTRRPLYYCGGNFIVRRDVAEAADRWDERLVCAEDGDYTARVSRHGRIVALPMIVGIHHTFEYAERTWGNLRRGYPVFDGILLRKNIDRPAVLLLLLFRKYRGFLWGYAFLLLCAAALLAGWLASVPTSYAAAVPVALVLVDLTWGCVRGKRPLRHLVTHYAYPPVVLVGLLLGGKPGRLNSTVEHVCGPEREPDCLRAGGGE